ncbi:MAG: hypothetical protein E7458_07140 [Ruminococcaceae bacterium]|nr:hypothetical protein [Oscillospiraceae bacterium]
MNEKKNDILATEQPAAEALHNADTTGEIRASRSKLLKKKTRKHKKAASAEHAPVFTRRRMTYGSISIGLTIAFIAAILVANLGVSYLTDRFYLKADITPTGVYEISDTSKILLENLNQDVTVNILLSEDDVINSTYYNVANEFLKQYRTLSGNKISINYVDIYKNPAFLNNYQNTDDEITAGSFIIESDLRYKVLKLADLYELSTTLNQQTYEMSQFVSGIDADQTLASAVQYVVAKDLPTVVFVNGHDEEYGPQFQKLFTNSNYGYDEVNLLFDEIPNDAAVVVIGMPSADYTAYEIEKLDNYMKSGGNIILFTGVSPVETPNLNEWLEEWGIGMRNLMLLDSARALYSPENIVVDIVDDTACEDLEITDTTYIMMPQARALEQVFEYYDNRTTTVLMQSSASSYGKEYSADTSFTTYDFEEGDTEGPFPTAILTTYGSTMEGVSVSSKLLVLSSLYMTSDSVFDIAALANKNFFMEAIDFINPMTEVLTIESREYYSENLTILSSQAQVVFWILIVIIPVAVLALGVVVWFRRRHK